MSQPGVGLTEDDYRKLADIAKHGPHAYIKSGGGNPPEPDGHPVTCGHCGHEWRYTGKRARATCYECGLKTPLNAHDGRGITPEQCNAIREAASDGQTYREIADLFTFIEDANPAWTHATGRCDHNGAGLPPVESKREPGPTNGVDAAECERFRRRYAAGEATGDIADALERHRSTVGRHVHGRCSHD